MITDIFTDAGLIGTSGLYGGTYAWTAIDESGAQVKSGSGIILALNAPFCNEIEEIPQDTIEYSEVEINVMEMIAIVEGLKNCAPVGWSGTLHTDSGVSHGRLTGAFQKWNGVPDVIRGYAQGRMKNSDVNLILLSGHPTRAELATGFDKETGRPNSIWNVWCDKEATRLAKLYQKHMGV